MPTNQVVGDCLLLWMHNQWVPHWTQEESCVQVVGLPGPGPIIAHSLLVHNIDQSLPFAWVYKLPPFLLLYCMPDEARDGPNIALNIKWPVGVLDRPKEPFYYQLSIPNNFHNSMYTVLKWCTYACEVTALCTRVAECATLVHVAN